MAFAYAASPSFLIPVPSSFSYLPSKLLSPGWMFVLAEITSMLPRAIKGHEWYKEKFGDKYPERKVVIPGLL